MSVHQQRCPKSEHRELLRLQKQIQGLRNEMEFVEILAQFWPLPTMTHKMERLEKRLQVLSSQYEKYKRAG